MQRLAERARIPIEFEMTPGQREEGSLKEKLRSLRRWPSAENRPGQQRRGTDRARLPGQARRQR